MILGRRALLTMAVSCAVLYALFSWAVHLHWLDAADLRLHRWVLLTLDHRILGVRWTDVTVVGAGTVATLAVGVGAFVAWRAGAGRTAVVILAFALLGGGAVDGFKALHHRPYPGGGAPFVVPAGNGTACPEFYRCTALLEENATVYCPSTCLVTSDEEALNATASAWDKFPTRPGKAYPSGHTVGATLSWGLVLLLGTRAVQRRRGLDPWAVATWAGIALVGGISRVPVHAHWWTDVVGGWLLGAALLAAAILVDDAWARPREDGPPPPWRLRL